MIRTKDITPLIKSNRHNKPQLPQLSEAWLTISKVWLGNHILVFSRNSFVFILAWVLWLIALILSAGTTTVLFTETFHKYRLWEEVMGERKRGAEEGGYVFVNTPTRNAHLGTELQA